MKDYSSSCLLYYFLFYLAAIALFQDKDTNNFSGVFVGAWKQCTVEEGGGICPDGNTCCPTSSSGPGTGLSSCISSRNIDEGRPGQCCDSMGKTGCGYGYQCDTLHFQQQDNVQHQQICRLLEPHIPHFNAPITPRYQLCQVSSFSEEALTLQGFPIQSFPQTPTVPTTTDSDVDADVNVNVDDAESVQQVLPYFNATYYSNMGSITSSSSTGGDETKFEKIETVLIIVHGSGGNADEYLCTGMSLIDADKQEQTLAIAPKFLVDAEAEVAFATEYFDDDFYLTAMTEKVKEDHLDGTVESVDNPLYWADVSSYPHAGHSFRYGSEALNTYDDNGSSSGNDNGKKKNGTRTSSGISSYDVMDQLLEYILTATTTSTKKKSETKKKKQFPAVTRIVVMGHSAGGQYVQRWSLLSNSSIIWDQNQIQNNDNDNENDNEDNDESSSTNRTSIDIRVVPANPRSYAYLDHRRMIRQQQQPKHAPPQSKREQQQQQQSQLRRNNENTGTVNDNDNDNDNTVNYDYVFAVPPSQDIASCPSYNQWEWGFDEDMVDVGMTSPYRDRALLHGNQEDIAHQYGTQRQVHYLVGGNDTIDLNHDGCEQYNHNFQGYTRNERGHHYYQALTQYFKLATTTTTTTTTNNANANTTNTTTSTSAKDQLLLHQFFEVPFSPHDHTIMFQSKQGREAIFGTTTTINGDDREWDYGNEIQGNGNNSSDWMFSSYMSPSWLYGLVVVVLVVLFVFIVMMIVKKKKNCRSSPTIISIRSQQQQQKYNDNNKEDELGFVDEPNGGYADPYNDDDDDDDTDIIIQTTTSSNE